MNSCRFLVADVSLLLLVPCKPLFWLVQNVSPIYGLFYLQTVLIVYLAHIGCMVPADSATIGVVDAIFTHFPITDSINSNVSTFTSDLRRMAAVMSNATNKSLVVLDEFGKGTCPVGFHVDCQLMFIHLFPSVINIQGIINTNQQSMSTFSIFIRWKRADIHEVIIFIYDNFGIFVYL